jgi:type IV pilus assembly protein PilV
MIKRLPSGCRVSGFTLVEVLVTAVIIAFGLLSLAGLQAKMVAMQMEAYQRAHALVLAEDMVARINSQRIAAMAGAYAATGVTRTVGTGDTFDPAADCKDQPSVPEQDLCEWSFALKGAAVTESAEEGDERFLGAMLGARGCVQNITRPNKPTTFRVSVAWQGLGETVAPSNELTCGKGKYDINGADVRRRVLALQTTLADLN